MNSAPEFEQRPTSPDAFDDAAPELLNGSSGTVAVRGMQRAVEDEQIRQLLSPVEKRAEF